MTSTRSGIGRVFTPATRQAKDRTQDIPLEHQHHKPMTPYIGPIWRIFFADTDPLHPASSPEGRFHHTNQPTLYASTTAEGCAVAIKRYVQPNDRPRLIQRFDADIPYVIDLRQSPDAERASVIWQDGPRPSPTWTLSDAARAQKAQAMLYNSRSRPDLTHIVLFRWTSETLSSSAAPTPWPTQRQTS